MGSRLACLLVPALAALLAACGPGGSYDGTAPDSNPPSGSSPDTVALSLSGLPAGASGTLTITGPAGFAASVATPQVSIAVPTAGSYTVTAAAVFDGNRMFVPQPAVQTIAVAPGVPGNAAIAYSDGGAFRLALQLVGNFASPLFLTAPAGDSRRFVVERGGTIRIISGGTTLATPFLSIPTRISTAGEGGLLSLAFDPQYASNGFFYVYLTDPTGDIAIERYRVSAGDVSIADPTPLRIITVTHRTHTNHKGGRVAFGPDGMLYAATGDGGLANDPFGAGQDLDTLLGKMLRIDVRNASATTPYLVPADNPFVGQAGRRPEIWAYGLRNPWRFAFDPPAGRLYIADVGQGRVEEVNAVDATAAGLNYGWSIAEGSQCFPNGSCSFAGITLPVVEYAHDATGGCSVTGGFVYRGNAIPELQGRYLYSDFCRGWLRSFTLAGDTTAVETVDWTLNPTVGQILSFGEDAQGELYMMTSAALYRIVRE